MTIRRRDFLKASMMATLGAAAWPAWAERRNGMPYRPLGKTGEMVSLLCLGGSHIGGQRLSDAESIRIMRTAVDEGVNFFDNAWSYHGGRSEERMGAALKDGYRDQVFLMTKHQGRDRETAREHLETSLRRLDVDVIDLWQFHEYIHEDDPERTYNEGALEFALEARDEGKIRYIGVTGHFEPGIVSEMIDRGFEWDAVQFPMNVLDYHYRSFERAVLPKALEKDIGVIGMKTLGGPGQIQKTGVATVEECLHYVMSQPVATVCSGMDSMEVLRQNIAITKQFRRLSDEAMTALRARCRGEAANGVHEPYKTVWHS